MLEKTRKELELLVRRVSMAKKTNTSNRIHLVLFNTKRETECPLKVLIIAKEGEEAVAEYAKIAILTEMENIEITTGREEEPQKEWWMYDLVMGLDYAATSNYIHKVYEDCNKEKVKFRLITSVKEENIIHKYKKEDIISYYNTEEKYANCADCPEESKFSMAAILAPVAIFYCMNEILQTSLIRNYFDEAKLSVNKLDISTIAKSLKEKPHVAIFGHDILLKQENGMLPTCIDIVDKLKSIGISASQEREDNIAGTLENAGIIVKFRQYSVDTRKEDAYSKKLKDESERLGIPYVEFGSRYPTRAIDWNLKEMFRIVHFVYDLYEEMEKENHSFEKKL